MRYLILVVGEKAGSGDYVERLLAYCYGQDYLPCEGIETRDQSTTFKVNGSHEGIHSEHRDHSWISSQSPSRIRLSNIRPMSVCLPRVVPIVVRTSAILVRALQGFSSSCVALWELRLGGRTSKTTAGLLFRHPRKAKPDHITATMAPKRHNARDITPSAAATTQTAPTTAGSVPATATGAKLHKVSLASKDSWAQVVSNVWSHYLKTTPQRTKLIDIFMAFLVVVGALQFLYCILAGNYVSRTPGAAARAARRTDILTMCRLALQCFSLWLLCDGWAVCPDW